MGRHTNAYAYPIQHCKPTQSENKVTQKVSRPSTTPTCQSKPTDLKYPPKTALSAGDKKNKKKVNQKTKWLQCLGWERIIRQRNRKKRQHRTKKEKKKLSIWKRIKQQREKREMQSRLQSKLLTQERKECFSFEFQIAAIRGFSSSRLRWNNNKNKNFDTSDNT